jgi:hypothetical protein
LPAPTRRVTVVREQAILFGELARKVQRLSASCKEAKPMDPDTVTRSLSPSWQRWFAGGLLLLFAAVSVQYTLKAANGGTAFVRWRDQIQEFDSGENPYQRHNYPNPPIMALLLWPLVQLPPVVGALCWFYLKVGMTLLALHWVFRLVEAPGQPFPPWAKALTVLLSLRPILGDLNHGNVNLFILFLVVAALFNFHRRRDVIAGTVLALAIACKVTPALFLPYFVWKRAWKAVAGCVAGLALWFWLVPGCVLGFAKNTELLHSWVDVMIVPYVAQGTVTSEHNNQSLPGLIFRLATHSPSAITFVNDQPVPVSYHNLVTLDPVVARWIVKGCMVLFAGLVIWTCRTPTMPRASWRLAAEFSLVVLGMLVFSERTWKHHCVTLLLPFAVLSYQLAICRQSPRLRAYLLGTLAAAALLMASTSTSLFGGEERTPFNRADPQWVEHGAKLAQVYGAYVWTYLLLAAALAVLLRRSSSVSASVLPATRPELAGHPAQPQTGAPEAA